MTIDRNNLVAEHLIADNLVVNQNPLAEGLALRCFVPPFSTKGVFAPQPTKRKYPSKPLKP